MKIINIPIQKEGIIIIHYQNSSHDGFEWELQSKDNSKEPEKKPNNIGVEEGTQLLNFIKSIHSQKGDK